MIEDKFLGAAKGMAEILIPNFPVTVNACIYCGAKACGLLTSMSFPFPLEVRRNCSLLAVMSIQR